MTSEVETIRTAATRMRALAEAATPGPWESDIYEVSQHFSRSEPWRPVVSGEVSCMSYCYGGTARGCQTEADAEFIAAADPPFVRAVADWLEAEAEGDGRLPHQFPTIAPEDRFAEIVAWVCQACGESVSEFRERTDCTVDWRPRNPLALAVARAFLGDPDE